MSHTDAGGGRTRLELIADAAIRLIAQNGLRAMTHRAVDAAAHLPQGSTSYYAPTRAALTAMVIERLAERSLADITGLVARLAEIQPAAELETRIRQVAGVLAESVSVVSARRDDMRARYALVLEFSDNDPFEGALTSNSRVAASASAQLVQFMERMGLRPSPAELAAIPVLHDGIVFALTSRPPALTPSLNVTAVFETFLHGLSVAAPKRG